MPRIARLLSALLIVGASTSAYAYRVRCNASQTTCEVDTKRLVAGDAVGIFNEDRELVALGRVKGLRGRIRIVKITKKWGMVQRDHDLQLIQDREAENPEKYYRLFTKPSEHTFGGAVGLTSLGVGEGFMAFTVEGYMDWMWKDSLYYVGRAMFLTGSGQASNVEEEIVTESLSVMAFGAMGGLAYMILPTKTISFRTELDLGFAYASAKIGGGYDVKDFIEGRIVPGIGLLAKGEIAALARMGSFRPYMSASFVRLHQSNSYGVELGFVLPLD